MLSLSYICSVAHFLDNYLNKNFYLLFYLDKNFEWLSVILSRKFQKYQIIDNSESENQKLFVGH